jgi:FAD/FMN-containing dehydrogenase
LIRFADSEAAVRYQTDSVMRLVDQRSEVATADEALWSEVAELDDRGAIALRMSVRLADCASALDGLLNCWPDGVVAADMGTGVIRAAVGADDSLGRQKVVSIREKARARGGSLIIERAPASLRRGVDAWGEIGETAELMKAIKSSFDPKSILNPGLLPV